MMSMIELVLIALAVLVAWGLIAHGMSWRRIALFSSLGVLCAFVLAVTVASVSAYVEMVGS